MITIRSERADDLAAIRAVKRAGFPTADEAMLVERLRDAGRLAVSLVVVLGEPRYSARFGFRPAAEFGLSDEYGGGDAFQALALTPGALPTGAGLVRYAPEFAALGNANH